MKLVVRLVALAALLLASPLPAADVPQTSESPFEPEPTWLQAGSSCEGTINGGAAEIVFSCTTTFASNCCQLTLAAYPSFVGTCAGDAEIICP